MSWSSRYCEVCERQTIHSGPKVNHILHLLLSVFTMGLFVWFLLAAAAGLSREACTRCGHVTPLFGSFRLKR